MNGISRVTPLPALHLWLPAALYSLLIAWFYAPALKVMVSWWEREDFNYCYLVPFVVVYMLWEKRKEFLAEPSRLSWWGVLVVGLGLGLFWVGELGGEFLTIYISGWLVVVGLCWLHVGWRKLKVIWFPLLLLVTLFPLPNFLYRQVSLKLQLISSQLGVMAIRLLGMSAYREGNIIDVGFTKLQVVEACNGLRYIFPLLVLGVILAYFYRAAIYKRLLLIAAVVPLSIVVNSGRIAFAALSHNLWGSEVAEGFLHDFSGWAIFMVSLGILLAFQRVLNKLPPRGQPAHAIGPVPPVTENVRRMEGTIPISLVDRSEAAPVRRMQLHLFARPVAALLLMGATFVFSSQIEFREKVPIRQPLERFPMQLSEWTGARRQLEEEFLRQLKFSDYILLDYRKPSGESVNFYVAYYETQRKGESIHSPETCLLGGGWVFTEKGSREFALGDDPGDSIVVNRVLMDKPGETMLAYFWFPQRGRNLTSAIELKLFNFWDALIQQRTDGSLVRAITPVRKTETPDLADNRLQSFVRQASPILDQFLPGRRLD